MDNFHIDVTAEKEETFKLAMRIAFSVQDTATHFAIIKGNKEGTKRLCLFWDEGRDRQPLPYEMTVEKAIRFAWDWLSTVEYPPQPDHDGDNHKGFRVYNEEWGHVDDDSAGIVAVDPAWAMYGK